MDLPVNRFKRALGTRHQLGCWCALPGGYVAEIAAGAGFDWLVLDTEHAPSDPLGVLPQLQALAAYDVAPVVRPAANDPVLIKRLLDLGAQTLIVPMVNSAAEAAAAVAAMRYPPEGIRGVAVATRATRFGRVAGYLTRAPEELCLIVQVETRAALAALEDIARTPGVDAVFIGPSDLAASLGHPGAPGHPEVQDAIFGAFERLAALGVPSGVLAMDRGFADRAMAAGTAFTAVGIDTGLLRAALDGLAASFRS